MMPRMRIFWVILGVALLGCAGTALQQSSKVSDLKAEDRPHPASVLPFVENDYARALDEARTKKKPLFIDAWAPW